jgi:hypothetical protein
MLRLGPGTLAGFEREALVTTPTWPATTPARVRATLPLLSGSVTSGVRTQLVTTTASATGGAEDADVLDILPRAEIRLACYYQGLEGLYACGLGHMAKRLDGVVLPEQLAPGVYRHLFEVDTALSTVQRWDADADGFLPGDGLDLEQRKVRRGTCAIARAVSVWELLSCMVDHLTFAGSKDGVTCTVQLLAHSRQRPALTNTAAAMDGLPRAVAPTLLFTDLVVRLGVYSASVPLDVTNEIGVTSWSLTVQNQLAAQPGPRTWPAPEEYERGPEPVISGQLLLPRYASEALVDGWHENTRYSLVLQHTGPAIGATGYHYQCTLYLPYVTLTQAEPSGPSPAPATLPVQWAALVPPAPAAGFPVMSRATPLALEVISGEPRHMLLAA